jgi:hypothetical protein
VTYKGAAVEGAVVTLQPASDTSIKPASGTTDASGNFTVSTFIGGADQAPGAMPGEYKVTVTKIAASTMTSEQMAQQMQSGGKMEPPKNELPEKYASTTSSGLTATVGADGLSGLKLDLVD